MQNLIASVFQKNTYKKILRKVKNAFHLNNPKAVFEEAKKYVGNAGEDFNLSGKMQFTLLIESGCLPHSQVLEIGCGALSAGRFIMEYLEPDHYTGIEPNKWLVDAFKRSDDRVQSLIKEKRPRFLYNTEFNGQESGRCFDFIISHSVLSHAADWQLPVFFENTQRSLNKGGLILASIRMSDAEGNLCEDSHDKIWRYPGNSFFSWETVQTEARKAGLTVEWKKEFREMYVQQVPSNIHDWIILRHGD